MKRHSPAPIAVLPLVSIALLAVCARAPGSRRPATGADGAWAKVQSDLARCESAPEAESHEICDEAARGLEETGAPVPPSESLYLRLAEGARALGCFDTAISIYRGAIRNFPDRRESYLRLAHLHSDRHDSAFEAYGLVQEAVRLDSADPKAREMMGNVELRMRRYADALESYAAARALAGDSWELSAGRAQALRSLGRNEEALQALVSARAWEPAHTIGEFSWQMRAEVLLDLDRPAEAVEELRGLLASDLVTKNPIPNYRSVPLCVLARALERVGDREAAARACEEARTRPARETRPCECGPQ